MDRKQFYQSRSGAVIGAARDIAEEPDEDAARVEQLRGHTAVQLFKNNPRGSANQIFSCGSVSAEMAIQSAPAGISRSHGFSEGNLLCHCSARAEKHFGEGGAFEASGTSRTWERLQDCQRLTNVNSSGAWFYYYKPGGVYCL